MSKKAIDPTDTYVVRELFACGDGHFLAPGFTHWKAGEVCPFRHDEDSDPHLYHRQLMVPTEASDGTPFEEFLAANAGKWGHLPLAPAGGVAA